MNCKMCIYSASVFISSVFDLFQATVSADVLGVWFFTEWPSIAKYVFSLNFFFIWLFFFHQTISLICTSDDLDVSWTWILFLFFLSRKTADSDYPQCHHELSSLQEAEDGDSPGETGQICMLCWSSQVWCGKWMCLLKMT